MTTPNEVMDKLAKLFALTQSDNEHEAALAGQRAAELMAKHQLNQAEVYAHLNQVEIQSPEIGRIDNEPEAPSSRRKQLWQEVLAAGISHGLGGKVFHKSTRGIFQLFMVGPPDSVAAARYLFMAISKEIDRLGRKAMREHGESNAWRRAYCLGMVQNVNDRINRGRATVLSSSTAMVYVNKMDDAIKDLFNSLVSGKVRVPTLKRPDARDYGYADGEQIDVGDLEHRQLSQGHKRLKD